MQIKPAPTQIINFQVAGSTIPDSSHACGACLPCKRLTVSLKCSTAESCPISYRYRCMCKGKGFQHRQNHSNFPSCILPTSLYIIISDGQIHELFLVFFMAVVSLSFQYLCNCLNVMLMFSR